MVGSPAKQSQMFSKNLVCLNSVFSARLVALNETLPGFATFKEDEAVALIKVESQNNDDAGSYLIEVTETDTFTKFVATTSIEMTIIKNMTYTADGLAFQTSLQSKGEDELIRYWFQPERKEKYDSDIPLEANIFDITATGNLTIVFNKPIIIPPIEFYPLNETRKLSESS